MPDRNPLTYLDWSVLLLYTIFVIILGSRFARRQTTAEHYFTASGTIPGWAAGMSMFATLVSSFVFIGFPGHTYGKDWQVLMQQYTTPFIIVGVALFIVPVYRRAVRISAYEYLEQRFGYFARVYGTIGFLVGHFTKIAIVMSATSMAWHGVTGWNQDATLLTLGLMTIAYTYAGGMEGVIWTDVVQGFLMLGSGVLTVLFILFIATPEGPQAVLQQALDNDKFKLIDPTFNTTDQTVWVIVWMGIFHFTSRYATDQTMVQRYLTAKSTWEAQKGSLIGVAACMAMFILFPLIGTLLYGFYQLHPERLAADITKSDQIFPYFIGHEIPPGMTGLILAGLFAATMSTLSSDLNSFSACVVSDFYDRFTGQRTHRRRVLVSRLVVLVVGLTSIALAAWIMRRPEGIMSFVLDAWATIGAMLGGGALAAFFLGFFCPRANWRGLNPALVAGVMLVAWCYGTKYGWILLPEGLSFLAYRWNEWWLMGFSNIFVFVTAYALSRLLGRGETAPLELTAYQQGDTRTPVSAPVPSPANTRN